MIRGGTLTSSHGGSIVVDTDWGVLDGAAYALTNDAYVEVTDYSAVQLEGTIINNGEIHPGWTQSEWSSCSAEQHVERVGLTPSA